MGFELVLTLVVFVWPSGAIPQPPPQLKPPPASARVELHEQMERWARFRKAMQEELEREDFSMERLRQLEQEHLFPLRPMKPMK